MPLSDFPSKYIFLAKEEEIVVKPCPFEILTPICSLNSGSSTSNNALICCSDSIGSPFTLKSNNNCSVFIKAQTATTNKYMAMNEMRKAIYLAFIRMLN